MTSIRPPLRTSSTSRRTTALFCSDMLAPPSVVRVASSTFMVDPRPRGYCPRRLVRGDDRLPATPAERLSAGRLRVDQQERSIAAGNDARADAAGPERIEASPAVGGQREGARSRPGAR